MPSPILAATDPATKAEVAETSTLIANDAVIFGILMAILGLVFGIGRGENR
ncbi:MAG: hypothetical protein AAFU85_24390 [Planctomycetota bacterium]